MHGVGVGGAVRAWGIFAWVGGGGVGLGGDIVEAALEEVPVCARKG